MSNQSDFFKSQIVPNSKDSILPKETNEISENQKVHLKNEIKDFLKLTFDAFDTDGSGNMDFKEFRRLIKIMGVKMTYIEIQQIFEEFDEDDSGSIEFYEYLNLMVNYFDFIREELTHSFDFINSIYTDQEGITEDKLEKLAETFNFQRDPEVIQKMIELQSTDGQVVSFWKVQIF